MNIPREEIPFLFKDGGNNDEISSSRGEVENLETHAVGKCGETKRSYYHFSMSQIKILEEFFMRKPRPSSIEKKQLSDTIGVDLMKVNNWFTNRNIKQKRLLEKKKMEEYETKNHKLRVERIKIKQACSPCTCNKEMSTLENDELMQQVEIMTSALKEFYDNPQMITQNEEIHNQTTVVADKPKKAKRSCLYTKYQIDTLERSFKNNPHPSPFKREKLGYELGIDPKKLNSWFQRRKRENKHQFELQKIEKIEAVNKRLLAENFKLMQSLPAYTCKICGGYINSEEQETQ